MSKAVWRFLVACLIPGAVPAQSDPHEVQPERPTVATHAGTVAPGWLEIETGLERDQFSASSRSLSFPTVFKIGLATRAQLSVSVPVVQPSGAGTGIGDVSVGVKWRIAADAPILGRFAVLPTIKFPTGAVSVGRGTGTTDAGLLLISSHDVGPVALDVNAGYVRRDGDGTVAPRSYTIWTVSTGGPAVGTVGWVAEVFGYPRTGGPAGQPSTVAALYGPTLAVRPWLALDAGVISRISGPQPHALYLGGVWNAGRLAR